MPHLNLLVLRVADLDRAHAFYAALGLTFDRHRHGSGPEHLASTGPVTHLTLELYPKRSADDDTSRTRLGFAVADLNTIFTSLTPLASAVLTPPTASPWGLRAVLKDPDGHTVELTQPQA